MTNISQESDYIERAALERLLRRAESLIAKGKDLPFKPSFGMLVIEWMRQIQREGM